jgi:hypothetical protein
MKAKPSAAVDTTVANEREIRAVTARKLELFVKLRELDLEVAKIDQQMLQLGADPRLLIRCW